MAIVDPPLQPPAILHAQRWSTFLAVLCGILVVGALLAGAAAWMAPQLVQVDAASDEATTALITAAGLRALCAMACAVALVVSAALLPAWLLTSARVRVAEADEAARLANQQAAQRAALAADHAGTSAPDQLFSGGTSEVRSIVEAEERRLAYLAGWPQALCAGPLAILAGAVAVYFWPRAGGSASAIAAGITAIVLSFPLLICERRLALARQSELPEALGLARLLRLLLAVLILGGCVTMARAFGLALAIWGDWVLSGLILVVSAELLLRALATPFLPLGRTGPRAHTDSAIADLVLGRFDVGHGTLAGLKERFGIDLSQSWALGFVRRALTPLLLVLALVAWLLSGITILSISERGIYERFGAPVAVLQPGLHLHLPWPLGSVRRIENGQIHSVPLGDEEATASVAAQASSGMAAIVQDADAIYDRLWDQRHPSEGYYIVPAPGIGLGAHDANSQSCQMLNCDVRVVYRIGMDDQAAYAALYSLANPQEQVREETQRLLLSSFASRTLLQVIGENRDSLSTAIKDALQHDLDRLASGLQIIAVVIGSIHPPIEAADAYHGVQAAEIQARTEVAMATSEGARARASAEQDATVVRDNAIGYAAERLSKARIEDILFSGEMADYRSAGQALVLDRWITALGRALARAQLTIIDHRLDLANGPTMDLRRFAPPQDKGP